MAIEPVMNVTYLQSLGVSSEQRSCAQQKGRRLISDASHFWLRKPASTPPLGRLGCKEVLVTLSLLPTG